MRHGASTLNHPIGTSYAAAPAAHVRRIRHIDQTLQRRLLIALVLMEVVILSVAMALLYAALNRVVEDGLYRVHASPAQPLFSLLWREARAHKTLGPRAAHGCTRPQTLLRQVTPDQRTLPAFHADSSVS